MSCCLSQLLEPTVDAVTVDRLTAFPRARTLLLAAFTGEPICCYHPLLVEHSCQVARLLFRSLAWLSETSPHEGVDCLMSPR